MKKLIAIALITSIAPAALTQEPKMDKQEIWVTVNGEDVSFKTSYPFLYQGFTMTPLRGVFEKIGARVDYDADTGKITAYKQDMEILLKVGSTDAVINGENTFVPVAPRIVSGSAVVPLRFLSESLGGEVSWSKETKTVNIYVPHLEEDLTGPISDPPRNAGKTDKSDG